MINLIRKEFGLDKFSRIFTRNCVKISINLETQRTKTNPSKNGGYPEGFLQALTLKLICAELFIFQDVEK